MLAGYLRAAIPRPVRLLNQELLPFSRGHLAMLLRHDCAFVMEGQVCGIGDLVLGVYVCCHSWEELPGAMERLSPALIAKWRKRVGRFDFQEKARAFAEYIAEGCLQPEVVVEGDAHGVRTPGAPFLLQLGIFLQGELNVTRSEAWNMPFGEALHNYYAFYELKGKCKIKGADEVEAERFYLEERGKILAEMGIVEEKAEGSRLKAKEEESGGHHGL